MKLSKRATGAIVALLVVGGIATCATSNSPSSQTEKREQAAQTEKAEETKVEPVVSKTTNYEVYRADVRRGVTGNFESVTQNTRDFSGFYATITDDGSMSFEIDGVTFNGKVERGDKTKTLYSGIQDYEATQLLIDGKRYGNAGTVDFEAFLVDQDVLIDMTKDEKGEGMVFVNYYLHESK